MREVQPSRKKKITHLDELCRAVRPLYYLSKSCGLMPVRFLVNASEGIRARLNLTDLFYSFFVLMLLVGAEIWGLWRDLKDGWEYSTRLKSRTAVIATCSDVLGVMSLAVVCIVGSPFRWKYLQRVINKLIEVDEKIGVPAWRKARRFTICLMTCSLLCLWINSFLDFYTWSRKNKTNTNKTDKGPINYAPLYFMYTVIILTEIQYTVSTYNIGQRFIRLNDSLKKLLFENIRNTMIPYFPKYTETVQQLVENIDQRKKQTTASDIPFVLNSPTVGITEALNDDKTYLSKISQLIIVHSSLCDAISFVNHTFGFVVLSVTVTCLLHLVITPYFLILQAEEKHEWIFLIVQGGWCIFHITRVMIIVQPSHFVLTEGRKTAVLVSQLLSCSLEENTRRELEIFSLQLLHRPFEFSACGLFSIDRTLITSIAGVVTTYLVILIQFQNADDTKGNADIIKNATQFFKNSANPQRKSLAGF